MISLNRRRIYLGCAGIDQTTRMASTSSSNNTTVILKEWIRNPILISTAFLGITSNIILLISIVSMKRVQDSYYSFVINIVIADLVTSVVTFINPLIKLIDKEFYALIGEYYCKYVDKIYWCQQQAIVWSGTFIPFLYCCLNEPEKGNN